ncbi:PadR family transcriptional regulator [Actinoplanes sp. RD1]|uniref:PadR family transcriptional regulator n=1 Tax=Actinoplanes sp. RD1 TaxID=3064538 RepID=UPI002742018D|nr:helix-turn-helix transcriptional regulator [Actinoplanes sp. RD1]
MAVLALLRERPRHPYEMQALLRERQVGAVVKIRGGSLYDTVQRSLKAGLVEPVDRTRSGARPERTVYALTDAGADLLHTLVRGSVAEVRPEYPVFPAGLAHILHLERAEAVELLHERCRALEKIVEENASALAAARESGVPPVVLLEADHGMLLRRTEIGWLRETALAIEDGTVDWAVPPTTPQE